MSAPESTLLQWPQSKPEPVTRALFDQVMIGVYVPSNMIPVRGQGSRVWDQEGREYIDLAAGIAVTSLGHANPALVKALHEQAQKLWLVSNFWANEPMLRLAGKLTAATFADRIFFCNSGAEANEAALKLARKHAGDHHGAGKTGVVSTLDSFHGRTLFTVTAGGTDKYKTGFGPLPPDIAHVRYNDAEALEAAVDDRTCAVILEPLQGEGGVRSGTREFLQRARTLCDRHAALLIFDEVQSGMGRTGTLYNYMQKGVVPDILTTAKGLGGGFPIGAMLTTTPIAASFSVGVHGTTFGGNPLACAVAEAVLDIVNTEEVLAGVQARSALLRRGLEDINEKHGVFAQVRGEGLLIGCELADAWKGHSKKFMQAGEAHGLMFLMAGPDVLRFVPSLIIPESDIAEALQRLDAAVAAVVSQR
jgi:acetylornithine/N-succinyldiaminopimelate aminotransferase